MSRIGVLDVVDVAAEPALILSALADEEFYHAPVQMLYIVTEQSPNA